MRDLDVFLAHFGVKGMKWGVRKDRSQGGVSRKEMLVDVTSDVAVDMVGGAALDAVLPASAAYTGRATLGLARMAVLHKAFASKEVSDLKTKNATKTTAQMERELAMKRGKRRVLANTTAMVVDGALTAVTRFDE